jgi:hypothetical protein
MKTMTTSRVAYCNQTVNDSRAWRSCVIHYIAFLRLCCTRHHDVSDAGQKAVRTVESSTRSTDQSVGTRCCPSDCTTCLSTANHRRLSESIRVVSGQHLRYRNGGDVEYARSKIFRLPLTNICSIELKELFGTTFLKKGRYQIDF